jgi:hypothetical protein
LPNKDSAVQTGAATGAQKALMARKIVGSNQCIHSGVEAKNTSNGMNHTHLAMVGEHSVGIDFGGVEDGRFISGNFKD